MLRCPVMPSTALLGSAMLLTLLTLPTLPGPAMVAQ